MTKLTPDRTPIDFLQPDNQDIKEFFTNIPPLNHENPQKQN